ncbi:thermonuclease family protein [Endozoicomonas lisbonensis]|uniref:Micrococcal nuclease n=1 Tax=Endozoicomonas lisbonensis TaxID=3120522 RepID=A0ABV2SEN8_9GAMM
MPTLDRLSPVFVRGSLPGGRLLRLKQLKKKALYHWVGAFFLSCTFVPFSWAEVDAEANCFIKGRSEAVVWDYIVDGDTLWLEDGRKVRLASVNTPETAHDGLKDEPFGDQATEALRGLLKNSPRLQMQRAERGEDKHGRVLAHLFMPDGRSVEAILLEKGLAFQLFPDDRSAYNDCFSERENDARKAGRGVWSKHPVLDISHQPMTSGFHLVSGIVMAVRAPRDSDYYWVDLNGPLVLRVLKSGADERWLRNAIGRKIEARGWVMKSTPRKRESKKYKPWIMGIYHSPAIKRIN